jgi:hypothetical protein
MRQVEVARPLVFDDPRRARVLRGARLRQVAIGRPEKVALVFSRPLRRPTKHPYGSGSSPPAPRSRSTSPASTQG